MSFGIGHPPPTHQLQSSLHVCRRAQRSQIFKRNSIISIHSKVMAFLVISLSPWSPHHPHSPQKVPMVCGLHMLSLWSPHHPRHPHVVPIAPRRSPCGPHGLWSPHVPMVSVVSTCCPHCPHIIPVIPTSSRRSPHHPQPPRHPLHPPHIPLGGGGS